MSKMYLVGAVAVILLVVAGVYFFVAPQETEKTYKIGILSGLDFFTGTAKGFREGMKELGYEENKNIRYDEWKTNFDEEAYRRILYKFIADKVGLIFVFPTEASILAKAVTEGTGIPVVFGNANIEGVNLVESVAEPGGNITGVRYPGPDLVLKRFEIMRELVPGMREVWIPYQRNYPIVETQLRALRPVIAAAGMTLTEVPASSVAELEENLRLLLQSKKQKPDAILLIPEPLGVTPPAFEVMGRFADEQKIPIGGAPMAAGNYESVFGVSTDNVHVGKQASALADKILKGIPAGTIPVVSAESFLEVNYRAAEKAGITVSEGLLNRANRIIR